jgi:hypothetical protein
MADSTQGSKDLIVDPLKSDEVNRRALDDEILRMEKCILNLKRQRNGFAPLHTLPNELLTEVFSLLNSDEESEVHTVAAVCCHWRAVALGNPNLWTVVDFREPWWHLYLSRSGGSALTLISEILDDRFIAVFSEHLHRVHECRFSWRKNDQLASLFSLLEGRQPPALTKLVIISTDTPSTTMVFNLNLPSLRNLWLSVPSIRWDSPNLGNLTHLVLFIRNTGVADSTIRALVHMQTLQFIEFARVPMVLEIAEDLPYPVLPRLDVLRIEGQTLLSCALYSSHLVVPHSAYICLTGRTQETSAQVSEVLRLIFAPKLEARTVVLDLDTLTTGIELFPNSELPGTMLPSQTPTTPNIASLPPGRHNALEIYDRCSRVITTEDWWRILCETSQVSSLCFFSEDLSCSSWGSFLALGYSKAAGGGGYETPLPNLQQLRVEGLCCRSDPNPDMSPSVSALLETVLGVRRGAGAKIRDLIIVACDKQAFGDMQAVEELVDRMDYYTGETCRHCLDRGWNVCRTLFVS